MTQETTPEQQIEVDYGEQLIFRLVGATITMFGANANGEIFLCTERAGVATRVIVGKDELGEITLYEADLKEVSDD